MRRILEKFSLFTFFTAATIMSASSISAVIPIESNFYITDTQNVLNDKTKEHIISVNEFWQQQEEKPQVAVIVTDKIDGADISEYIWEQFESMDWGNDQHENGALILVATEDKQIDVEVGYGLEYAIEEKKIAEILGHAERYISKGDFSDGVLLTFNQLVFQIHEAYGYEAIIDVMEVGGVPESIASIFVGLFLSVIIMAFYYLIIFIHHLHVHIRGCRKDGLSIKMAFKTFLSPTSGVGWHHPRNTRLRQINLEDEEKRGK